MPGQVDMDRICGRPEDLLNTHKRSTIHKDGRQSSSHNLSAECNPCTTSLSILLECVDNTSADSFPGGEKVSGDSDRHIPSVASC